MIAFLGIAVYFLTRPTVEVQWQEKAVFSAFFVGAILCLGFSWIFHTVYCHSERVGRFFNKSVAVPRHCFLWFWLQFFKRKRWKWFC